ncbi:MAG: UDP-N-acetylmuramoyl-L-alanine--D-glutamate ligase [Holosporales bacterium]|jgi:UDP-N-acetylmuramoylalanine--D-glutamate ligase|nr:UDP-N-acetylmuramoyl-L-alanine--D-glutamate ligase [Holosporales bacterium]
MFNHTNKILLIGYGISGKSIYKFLKAKGYQISVFDDFTLDIPDKITKIDWDLIDIIIKSPSIPFMPHNCHRLVQEAETRNIPIISTFDTFILFNPGAKIVGITGTNGKSTTVALTQYILKKANINSQMGGNIGIPYFDLPKADVYIFEMSSYELAGSKHLNFEIGCILNIEKDHLEFHGNFEEYVKAKHKILDHSKIKIISAEDTLSVSKYPDALILSTNYDSKAYAYILENALFGDTKNIVIDLSGPLKLIGQHNHQNIEFSYAICRNFGVPNKKIENSVISFEPLPHRLNIIKKAGHILFVNDSKATNPESAAKALRTFTGYKIYWLIGGISKKINPLTAVEAYLENVQRIYMFGESANEFKNIFKSIKRTIKCKTMIQAIEMAYKEASHTEELSVILLSPMCASFDQFKNFEHRGDEFIEAVIKLTE